MAKLYPPIQPFSQFFQQVSDNHSLYCEQSGSADGYPVLYLHGGPGACISPFARRYFNPLFYRVITFDQRGCGQSTPALDVANNTTEKLIEDIESIRQELGIERWVVCGGSWGTTLALAYALAYPERVTGMILRGIFLSRQQDIEWFLAPQGGAAQMFPEHFNDFIEGMPQPSQLSDIFADYQQRLFSDNELMRLAAAKQWCRWEGTLAQMHADPVELEQCPAHLQLSMATLEWHYLHQRCFLPENHLLQNIAGISHIPATLVHGRYDMVCKLEGAYALHQAWENSQLCVVPNAPHSGSDPLIASAMCAAADAMAGFIQGEQK